MGTKGKERERRREEGRKWRGVCGKEESRVRGRAGCKGGRMLVKDGGRDSNGEEEGKRRTKEPVYKKRGRVRGEETAGKKGRWGCYGQMEWEGGKEGRKGMEKKRMEGRNRGEVG